MEYLSSEFLLNLLIFTIVFYFTYKAMMKYLKNQVPAFVIAISASGLTIYYTRYNQEFFTYVNVGYTGFAILTLLPTIILFHTLYKTSFTGAMRKIVWVVYSSFIIYILYNSSYALSPDIVTTTTVIILATIFLLLFDNKIKENIDIKKNFKPFY
jgi:hypothetical protein